MGCCGGGHGNTRVEPIKNRGDPSRTDYDEFDGPLENRSCTDIFCIFFFLAFLGGMGYVAYLAWDTGDPFRIIYGTDSYGNTCNRNNDPITDVSLSGRNMQGKTKTFYFNYLAIYNSELFDSMVLCVEKCPDSQLNSVTDMQTWCTANDVKLCRYDLAINSYHNGSDTGDTCPSLPVLQQDDVLNRCVPTALVNVGTSIFSAGSAVLSLMESNCQSTGDFFEKIANDLESTWKEILYIGAIAIGVAFVMTLLMRFLAAIIVYTIVITLALGCLASIGYFWYSYYTYWSALQDIPEANRLESDKKKVNNWLIYASCVSAGAGLVLLILFILRKRITLVVQLFHEAGKCIAKMPLLLIQPIWTLFMLGLFCSGLLYVYMYVETSGDPVIDSSTGFVTFKKTELLSYMRWYYLLGLLWMIQFIFACHQMTIAGSVASWYFTRDKSELSIPILRSIGRLVRYHLGTVLFGSFIIALIQLARIILAYIQRKLAGNAGPLVDFLLKMLQCCLWCFEKFMKFINKNAYIMCAIYGYNFCKSAATAFSLLLKNVLRVAAINSVGFFILFLGKIGVVVITEVIAFEWLKNEALCYFWSPMVVIGIWSFIIAHCFIGVYSMVIDTIFLCFCEDADRNDGVRRPYYMSRGLMEYVENSRKALEAEKKRAKERKAKWKAQNEPEAPQINHNIEDTNHY